MPKFRPFVDVVMARLCNGAVEDQVRNLPAQRLRARRRNERVPFSGDQRDRHILALQAFDGIHLLTEEDAYGEPRIMALSDGLERVEWRDEDQPFYIGAPSEARCDGASDAEADRDRALRPDAPDGRVEHKRSVSEQGVCRR